METTNVDKLDFELTKDLTPSRASYGVSIVSILEEIDGVTIKLDCIMCDTDIQELSECGLKTYQDTPELGQYQLRSNSIGVKLAWFWHIRICSQRVYLMCLMSLCGKNVFRWWSQKVVFHTVFFPRVYHNSHRYFNWIPIWYPSNHFSLQQLLIRTKVGASSRW